MKKIAIAHEWFASYAGSERVVEQMLAVYPQADLFSLVDFLDPNQRRFIQNKPVQTSFIQNLPFARRAFRQYLPLMPLAVEQFDLSAYDLVISSSHAVTKGVITGPDQLHLCMCYSPIRYAWDLQHQYLRESGSGKGVKGWLVRWMLHQIRQWDYRTANGVDHFIAISDFIARRIWKVYRRRATVIYPPVDVDAFEVTAQKQDFYLAASRLVPYKRMDLIVRAFAQMPDRQLVVIGDGPEMMRLRSLSSDNIKLLGYQSSPVLKEYLQAAKAFIFAAEEDFGILPVEAQAAGTPVIAYGRGGALETVVEGKTGLFFEQQTVEHLIGAVETFEDKPANFDPWVIRQNAERFSVQRFQGEFQAFVEEAWMRFQRGDALE
ncbi:MAG: glycosyltransferase family 4 protein [Cyanobacteria bacterium]|nr:glycosyltransferase family 4 protein [Cyanobacteriota bacterium]